MSRRFRKVDLWMIRGVMISLVVLSVIASILAGKAGTVWLAVPVAIWLESSLHIHRKRWPFHELLITVGNSLCVLVPIYLFGRNVSTVTYIFLISTVYLTMAFGLRYGFLALFLSLAELYASMYYGLYPRWTLVEFAIYLVSLASAVAIIGILGKYMQVHKELAIKDGLTNVYNHRYMQESLDRIIDESQKKGERFVLIFADIDHFKHFNDTYGHIAGDRVLHLLGKVFREMIYGKGYVYRYGGEEFAFLLPGMNMKDGLAFVEALRRRLESVPFPHEPVTLSYGLVVYPDHGTTKEELLSRSDEALYQAKTQRNCWRVFGSNAIPMS